MNKHGMSESAIQKVIANKLRKAGFLTTTYAAPSGWPDIRAFGSNRTIVIEVKRKGRKPSDLQYEILKKFRDAGVEVYVMDDTKEIDGVINMSAYDILLKRLKRLS